MCTLLGRYGVVRCWQPAGGSAQVRHDALRFVRARGIHYVQRLCLDEVKRGEKVTSVTVVHCSTFRLFVINIVLP